MVCVVLQKSKNTFSLSLSPNSLPSIEQKLNFTYLEAREFGASGANCEEFPSASKCPIATNKFDQLFYLIKQLFWAAHRPASAQSSLGV